MKNFTSEKVEDKTVYYRNGSATMIALKCPDKDDKEFHNVVVLKRVNKISPLDILTQLLGV